MMFSKNLNKVKSTIPNDIRAFVSEQQSYLFYKRKYDDKWFCMSFELGNQVELDIGIVETFYITRDLEFKKGDTLNVKF